MKQSNKCCESFGEIRHQFRWFTYKNDKGGKVYCMPHLMAKDGITKLRVNYCPCCGMEARGAKLTEK